MIGNQGTINGDATLNEGSGNSGTINGNVLVPMSNLSFDPIDLYNLGSVTGTVIFLGTNVTFTLYSTQWLSDTSNWIFTNGGQKWIFYASQNSGIITGNCQFNEFSQNSGIITGNCQFNEISQNCGIITGNCQFNEISCANLSVVNGLATFNYDSYDDDGTVDKNLFDRINR